MEFLRHHRRELIALTLVFLVAIVVLAPQYNDLQLAADADAFRDALPDGERNRYIGATIADFLFAAAYAATALALTRPGLRLSIIGAWVLVAGAVFDEIENSFVLAGVLDEGGVTDGAVDAMRLFGTLKWVGIAAGLVLMAVALVQARRSDGRVG